MKKLKAWIVLGPQDQPLNENGGKNLFITTTEPQLPSVYEMLKFKVVPCEISYKIK